MAKNDITVKIIGDASSFTRATTEAGTSLGRLAATVTRHAGPVIAAGFVAAGAGLVALGGKFDSAYDKIQIATGATGDALQGLQDSFDTVLASGPSGFDDVSTAISGLNQRLGLTGQPLEDLSTQMLDLSRITGTDVSTNIENMSQVMNKWNIPAADMGDKLDELFRASQATGIGVDDLGAQMTRFGAPLQELGFSFDEAAALLGGFEENGINTTAAMTGMRRALGSLRKPGETGRQTLERLTDQYANAGTDADATALAIELFGQKAGPEMAAAIRDGKFSLDDYMATIEDGQSTIEGTAASTDDFGEKWKTLKNQVFVKLKPLAEKMFNAITTGMKWLMDHQGILTAGLITFGVIVVAVFTAWAISAAMAAAATLAAAAPFILIGAAIAAVVAGIIYAYKHWKVFRDVVDAVARFFRDTVWPIIQRVFKAIVSAAEAVVQWFRDHWTGIKAVVEGVVRWLRDVAWPIVKGAFDAIIGAGRAVVTWFQDHWGDIKGIVDGVVQWFKDLPGKITGAAGALVQKGKDLIQGLWDGMKDLWEKVRTRFTKFSQTVKDWVGNLITTLRTKGAALLSGFWNGMKSTWDSVKTRFTTLASTIKNWVGDLISTLRTKGAALLSGFWNGMQTAWDNIATRFKTLGSTIKGWVGDLITTLRVKGAALLSGFWNGMKEAWDNIATRFKNIGTTIKDWVGDVTETLWRKGYDLILGVVHGADNVYESTLRPFFNLSSRIYGIVGDLSGTLWNAGYQVIHGFYEGAKWVWDHTLGPFLSGIANAISYIKGPPSYDAKVLIENGELIMQGFQKGLLSGWQDTKKLLGGMTAGLNANIGYGSPGKSMPTALPASRPSGGGGGTTIINYPQGVTARDAKAADRRYTRTQAA